MTVYAPAGIATRARGASTTSVWGRRPGRAVRPAGTPMTRRDYRRIAGGVLCPLAPPPANANTPAAAGLCTITGVAARRRVRLVPAGRRITRRPAGSIKIAAPAAATGRAMARKNVMALTPFCRGTAGSVMTIAAATSAGR